MKKFANLLFGYIFLAIPIRALDSSSFHPIRTIEVKGNGIDNNFGYSAKSAGDINNDGYDDIIIGAFAKNNNQGAVYVIYGGETASLSNIDLSSRTLDPLTTGFTITGTAQKDYVGHSVSSAGDINNDGYADIIIGAYYQNSKRGAAYVIYGGEKSSLKDIDLSSTALDPSTTGFNITGNAPSDSLGISVRGAGDINKDGYADILIGASTKSGSKGAAYVIYGGEKSSMSNIDLSVTALNWLTTGFMITGVQTSSAFGRSVNSAGDVNKDGYDDIIIGAPHLTNYKGAVYVIYGGEKSSLPNLDLSQTPLDPLTTGFTITGSAIQSYFGYRVSSTGDINSDGYADIIIGAYASNNNEGAAYIIYGGEKASLSNFDLSQTALDPLSTGFMITGGAQKDYLGMSVDKAGDINNDGYADFMVGAHLQNGNRGAVHVFYGGKKSSLPNIDLSVDTLNYLKNGFSVFGTEAGGRLGYDVSSGDLNNDGVPDLIIGAYGENSNTGAVYLILNKCPKNCDTCSSSTYCESCLTPYLRYSGKCLKTCPRKTFPSYDRKECQNCPRECFECTGLTTCQACIDGYTLSESQCIKDQDSQKVAAGVFEGTSLVGSSLNSGSSLPLNFGLVAKILRNIRYMKLPVSQELYEVFVSWKVATGFMSAPKSWSEEYSSKEMPRVFSRYGLQSAFLMNFWKPLVMALIGMAVFGIFKLIEVFMGENRKSIGYTITKTINVAASNFALTQFYGNLDDGIFYFILEMRSTEFETGFRVCSSLLALVLLIVGGVFLGLHVRLIAKYQNYKGMGLVKAFESKCENFNLIFKDFKDENSFIQAFLLINVIRSVGSNLIFATMFEYPMVQISFLFVLNILMIVYLLKKKSFKEIINTCGQIFCEVILFIANICVFLLALFDHAESYPKSSIENLGKCIIVLNFILLFGCAILLVVNLGIMLYKGNFEKKKMPQISMAKDNSSNVVLPSAKFGRPDQNLAQSNQSLSTTNNGGGILNESQIHLQSMNKMIEENYENPQIEKKITRSPKRKPTKSKSVISRPRNFHIQREDIEMPSSNIEDFGERSQPNLFSKKRSPRRGLVRNREITQARIDRVNYSPESNIQDPSINSRIFLNQEETINKDVSLTNLEMGIESPPLRGKNFMPRRRTQDNENVMSEKGRRKR